MAVAKVHHGVHADHRASPEAAAMTAEVPSPEPISSNPWPRCSCSLFRFSRSGSIHSRQGLGQALRGRSPATACYEQRGPFNEDLGGGARVQFQAWAEASVQPLRSKARRLTSVRPVPVKRWPPNSIRRRCLRRCSRPTILQLPNCASGTVLRVLRPGQGVEDDQLL